MKVIVSALLLLIVIEPSAHFAQVHELPTAANMKVLGLVGGTSWHSTVEYYRYINQEVNDLYGSNTNPPLVLYNLNQNEIHALQLSGRWDRITDILSEAAMKLRAAGAQAVMFCANTPHKVYAAALWPSSSPRARFDTSGCPRPAPRRSAAHTPSTPSPPCRRSTLCGPATRRPSCYRCCAS